MNPRSDDDGWMRALAGQPGDDVQGASALEAGLLRAALLRTSNSASAPVPPTPAEEHAFLQRLERERGRGAPKLASRAAPRGGWSALGTAEARTGTCEGCAERGARWKAWWLERWRPVAGAMASLTAAAIVVWSQLPSPADAPVMRGSVASAVQLRADAQPQLQRDELARRLAGLGAQTRRYERLGRFGVDASFAVPLAPPVADQLKALGLVADADGVVRVEFEDRTR